MRVKPWIDGIVWNAADIGGGVPTEGVKPAESSTDGKTAEALLYGGDKPVEAKPDEKPVDPAKPADDKAVKDAKADEKPKDEKPVELKPEEVPADGKYVFTMPEGVEMDMVLAEQAMPVFKEMNLSRANADKAVKLYAEVKAKEVAAAQENWDKINADWIATAKADKEYGGDKFDASLATANKVLSKIGTPGLLEYLKVSGGGNHPEVIRFMARVGNLFSDDKPTGSTTNAAAPKTAAQILYPES